MYRKKLLVSAIASAIYSGEFAEACAQSREEEEASVLLPEDVSDTEQEA